VSSFWGTGHKADLDLIVLQHKADKQCSQLHEILKVVKKACQKKMDYLVATDQASGFLYGKILETWEVAYRTLEGIKIGIEVAKDMLSGE